MNDQFLTGLEAMRAAMTKAPPEVQPSSFWQHLNERNLESLRSTGFANFKRSVALNYFTWVVGPEDPQVRFLRDNLPCFRVLQSWLMAKRSAHHEGIRSALSIDPAQTLTRDQTYHLSYLTYLLWFYARRVDSEGILGSLVEPLAGNPPRVFLGGKLISQDLANSALEYMSIMGGGVEVRRIRTILELGAGYGRTAYVFLKLNPGLRYIVSDIPPALAVAQEYLCSQFPSSRALRFREFDSYDSIAAEFADSQLVFLLPHQLSMLPDQCVDMGVNISSLHEMTHGQIDYYFSLLRRLVAGYFYLKAWKVSELPGNVTVTESDYPFPRDWRRLFWRECRVQTKFFEALHAV